MNKLLVIFAVFIIVIYAIGYQAVNPKKVEWLYKAYDKPKSYKIGSVEVVPLTYDPNVYFIVNEQKITIGFREDGVVVWRKAEK